MALLYLGEFTMSTNVVGPDGIEPSSLGFQASAIAYTNSAKDPMFIKVVGPDGNDPPSPPFQGSANPPQLRSQ